MWRIQSDGVASFGEFLKDCRAEAGETCDTVLLSGEDFENAIVDLALARDIEAQARAAGFDEIIWVVVTRDSADYAASIYSEMCKHGVVLQRKVVDEALARRGCLYLATQHFNYIFVLDFARFRDRFAAAVSGAVWHYEMADFMAGHPGDILLKRLMEPARYEGFLGAAAYTPEVANKRLSAREVEARYVATALTLSPKRRRNPLWRLVVGGLARLRR